MATVCPTQGVDRTAPISGTLPRPAKRTLAHGLIDRIGHECLKRLYTFLSQRGQTRMILNPSDRIASRQAIQQLDLDACKFTPQQLESLLLRTPCLSTLTLYGPWKEDAFKSLEQAKSLQSLTLEENQNGAYEAISPFARLTHLSFEDSWVKSTFFEKLNKESLESLSISGSDLLDVDLTQFPCLKYLSITNCAVGQRQLQQIAQLTSLQHLTIARHHKSSMEDVCSALQGLRLSSNINALDFSNCFLMFDNCLENLPATPLLEDLNLSECMYIGDAGIRALERFSNLQTLNLKRCMQITDVGFASLAKFPRLKHLNLRQCVGIKDFVLDSSSDFSHLESLILSGSFIDEAGLENLARLPRLRNLHLQQCPLILEKHLEKFRQIRRDLQLPEVEILYRTTGPCPCTACSKLASRHFPNGVPAGVQYTPTRHGVVLLLE